ncbi:MAG: TFIIB-type zinc ribbon-containing protein [Planctomycetota bacterium]|jgi:Zn-finger nucleic acid-binding protein
MTEKFYLDEVREGERPCPVCGERMTVEVKYDVHLDVCADHGIWLDKGELPAITMAVRDKGRRRRRQQVRDAKRSGKMQGAFFGFWSLLMD